VQLRDGQVVIDLPYSSLSMLDSVTDERVFYAIYRDQDFVTGYDTLPIPAEAPDTLGAYKTQEFLGETVRITAVQRVFAIQDVAQNLTVAVAQTQTNVRQTVEQVRRWAIGMGVAFFVATVLVTWGLVEFATQPLRRLAQSISRRGPKDLRPVAAPVPREMAPLVMSLNSLMQRLQVSLKRSEEFIAEAAHRVRTPLAIVRTQADVTLHRVEKEQNRKALRDIVRAIDESSRAAGQLLDHAMVTFRADDLDKERVDLTKLVQSSLEQLRPLAELRDIELIAELDCAVSVQVDPILIQNAVHNVLDNAIKYTPLLGQIQVSVHATPTQAQIMVTDSGQGFPDGGKSLLTQRFQRGDNVAGVVGSGLGLTIVRDVMAAHNGTLEISNIKQGGACVILSLPLE
jgi:two-component system sensor histidine kinase TctE